MQTLIRSDPNRVRVLGFGQQEGKRRGMNTWWVLAGGGVYTAPSCAASALAPPCQCCPGRRVYRVAAAR